MEVVVDAVVVVAAFVAVVAVVAASEGDEVAVVVASEADEEVDVAEDEEDSVAVAAEGAADIDHQRSSSVVPRDHNLEGYGRTRHVAATYLCFVGFCRAHGCRRNCLRVSWMGCGN